MADIYTSVSPRRGTPQSERADPRQKKNAAGGFTFEVSLEERVRRFLVLGTEGGTYYAKAQDLTKDNAAALVTAAETDHAMLRRAILDVSLRGAAPKQNPTLFALAIACSFGEDEDRKAALALLPQVARTGTHLFLFARYIEQFRGWGRGLRRAVADWYLGKDADSVAFQAVKYAQREGWSHRDLLRLSHPHAVDQNLRSTFEWIVRQAVDEHTPQLILGFIKAQAATSPAEVAKLVGEYRLSWEMLPDSAVTEPVVWEALLKNGLPQTALIRQLPRLTRLGLLASKSWGPAVAKQLADTDRLVKARVHPMNVLMAMRTYEIGHSERGNSTWTPVRQVVDALDAAFYNAFGAVEPANKRTLLALDVSGSMTWATIGGLGALTPREASAAMALVQMSTEPDCDVVGFTGGDDLTPLTISPRQRLTDAVRSVSNLPFGRTDCSLPMVHALEKGLEYDTFCLYTDNETWAGRIHPHEALQQYRTQTGINAKLVVLGMTSTGFSIADPTDPGMLDLAGLDSAVPSLINTFSRGL